MPDSGRRVPDSGLGPTTVVDLEQGEQGDAGQIAAE
jgi:hypothetical protein